MRRRGFTLLEVLVAVLVMGLVLVVVLEGMGRSIRAHKRVALRTTLLPLAEGKMDEILKEPVIQEGEEEGDYGEELEGYEWEAIIEPSADENVFSIRVRAFTTADPTDDVTLTCLRRVEIGPLESQAESGGSAL